MATGPPTARFSRSGSGTTIELSLRDTERQLCRRPNRRADQTDQAVWPPFAESGGWKVAARTFSLRPEPWRWSRPRVLVEHRDEVAGLAIASGLRLAGYAVAVCAGPHERGKCPLTGPDGCAAVHDSDLVVSCLGFEREAAREVLHALRARCPDVRRSSSRQATSSSSSSIRKRRHREPAGWRALGVIDGAVLGGHRSRSPEREKGAVLGAPS